MNEKIRDLAGQAGFRIEIQCGMWCAHPEELERFAELVRQDERDAAIDIVARHGGSVEIEAAIMARNEK